MMNDESVSSVGRGVDSSGVAASDASVASESSSVSRGRGRRSTEYSSGESEMGRGRGKGSLTNESVPPAVKKMTEEMRSARIEPLHLKELPKRPGVGTLGRKIDLEANFFAVAMKNGASLIVEQYSIYTECARKLDRDETRVVFTTLLARHPHVFPNKYEVIFDGQHIVFSLSSLRLKNESNEIVCALSAFVLAGVFGAQFELEVPMVGEGRPRRVTVTLQFTGRVHVDLKQAVSRDDPSTTPLQLLDCLFRQLRSDPANEHFYPFARSIFMVPGPNAIALCPQATALGGGAEMWTGLFAASKVCGAVDLADRSNWKPLLNIDLSYTAFHKKTPVIDLMVELFGGDNGGGGGGGGGRGGFRGGPGGGRGGGPGRASPPSNALPNRRMTDTEINALERHLKSLKVEVSHSDKKLVYAVRGVTRKGADELTFDLRTQETEQAQSTTVQKYFAERYGRDLRFPHLPCLHVGPRVANIWMPVELCQVREKQKRNKKLDDTQTAIMIRQTAIPAPQRRVKTLELAHAAFGQQDPYLEAFGMCVDLNMQKVTGRVLEPPVMQYAKRTVQPRGGEWKFDREQFLEGGSIKTCALIDLSNSPDNVLQAFYFSLLGTCQQRGMAVEQQLSSGPTHFAHARWSPGCLDAEFDRIRGLCAGGALDLVIVVMAGRNADIYSDVKRVGDIHKGVMTQCVLRQNIADRRTGSPSQMTMNNIALKINMKRNGINAALTGVAVCAAKYLALKDASKQEAVLYVGVDVSHPAPTDTRSPSLAAIVANFNGPIGGPTKYGGSVMVLPNRRESIVYMGESLKNRLIAYYRGTRAKPSHIVIYRDGVSEGEFLQVLNEEMASARVGCKQLSDDYKPKITFVVVQKRHHTRLYARNQQDQVGRSGNIPPGTVVDSRITHPYEFDFYLCSHTGIQGTSKPTHYYVLHDDNGFAADELQAVTFALCHVYGRCPRSVSLPAPLYFADLCCERARYHVSHVVGHDSSASRAPDGQQSEVTAELHRAVVKAEGTNPMYFV